MPFTPGRSGNPAGAPVGSRHRQQLNGEFIAALLRDFRQGGPKAIERVRRTQPGVYMKICALLVPREMKIEQTNPITGLSDEQLDAMIDHLQASLAARAGKRDKFSGYTVEFSPESRKIQHTISIELDKYGRQTVRVNGKRCDIPE